MTRSIVLISDDPATVTAVRAALPLAGQLASQDVYPELGKAAASLASQPASAAIVDIDPEPEQALARLRPIIGRFPQTRFLLVARSDSEQLVREAMRVGARDLIAKAAIATQLPGSVGPLDQPAGQQSQPGQMVVILSAAGGVGATTLAVNLAFELQSACDAKDSNARVLLVDLDPVYGAVAGYLGIESQFGLADLLSDPRRIDIDLVRSTATACLSGMAVLLSPASTRSAGRPLALENLGPAIEACRQAFSYVVVDAPRLPPDAAALLAASADRAYLAMQLNVKDVRQSRTLLARLGEFGVLPGQVIPLACRCQTRWQMVSIEEARIALAVGRMERVGNDFRSAIRGINYGQPLAQAARRSPLRRDVRRIAAEIMADRSNRPGQRRDGNGGSV